MSHRDHFFSVLTGGKPEKMPFFPDITDWYIANRMPKGKPRGHATGALIPDSDPIHANPGTIPEPFRKFTLLDFYRNFDWGFHAHIYDWYDIEYANGVERIVEQDEKERRICLRTPKGELLHRDLLAADGTWCPHEHFVKKVEDFEILRVVVESERYTLRADRIESVLRELDGLGQADISVRRSPFGKLIQEYMGFEKVVYALADTPEPIREFLILQEEKDMEVIALAARGPQRLVIISDHADENLISPHWYEQYCIPFYLKATAFLHRNYKFVSTHLDGNFKGHFPLLKKTGFDLLDGCTPAPMFNYEVEELAEALPQGMYAFCGVPSCLFCQSLPTEQILSFGDRIMKSLKGRAILNIGDVLPPDGNIDQVIALGKYVGTL